MTQNPFDGQAQHPYRPTLLTILCFVTFIASGFRLVSAINTYYNAQTQAEIIARNMEQSREMFEEIGQGSEDSQDLKQKLLDSMTVMQDPDRMRHHSVFMIISSVLCLFGAFLMYRLKKPGYWFYALGAVTDIVGPWSAYGTNAWATFFVTFGPVVAGLVMLILYGVNYKHLKS